MKKVEKVNLREWLQVVDTAAKGNHYQGLYKRVASLLETPSRRRGSVSLYKLNISTKDGDNVIVPKKVLSTGKIDHKISIAALEYSTGALNELKSSGCSIVDIKEMVGRNKISIIM